MNAGPEQGVSSPIAVHMLLLNVCEILLYRL